MRRIWLDVGHHIGVFPLFQVPPAELEAILITHPGIRDAGVIGKPDDEAGELPLAFVVRQPNSNITEKEVLDYVAGKNNMTLGFRKRSWLFARRRKYTDN